MGDTKKAEIFGKIIIKVNMRTKTGLRIGGADVGIDIGGIDLSVIRDPVTYQPYVPGSSLKGKMRSLLERFLDLPLSNHNTEDNPIYRHECSDENCPVCRVFGSAGDKSNNEKGKPIPSRLLVRDAFLTEDSVEKMRELDTDLPYTEWKTENALDRITSKASPRHLERVPAGAEFEVDLVYTITNKKHLKEDLKNIFAALQLVEDDYLGGGGSRGSGKVEFKVTQVVYRSKEYYLESADEKMLLKEGEHKSLEKIKESLNELLNEITQ